MKQGYFAREIGSGRLPKNIEDQVREDINLIKKAIANKPDYEIVPFIGETHCQLYSSSGTNQQPKDYDYGNKYGCKASERTKQIRNRGKR